MGPAITGCAPPALVSSALAISPPDWRCGPINPALQAKEPARASTVAPISAMGSRVF
jgi:hypothetical protein